MRVVNDDIFLLGILSLFMLDHLITYAGFIGFTGFTRGWSPISHRYTPPNFSAYYVG
jgi:hypothetical protein